MNIYAKKTRWKFILFLFAILIGLGSMLYTQSLVSELKQEEREKLELWAEATRQIIYADENANSSPFLLSIIEKNHTVPIILADENDQILSHRNLNPERSQDSIYLQHQLQKMKKQKEPIRIDLGEIGKNFIYYKDSVILTKLKLYPVVQLALIMLFILVSYFAFSSSRKAEQNQVWLGLTKETAHQLGTPTSSLVGWVELLKEKFPETDLIEEFRKDVHRLEKITERFSKIGSTPLLEPVNLHLVIRNALDYFKHRASTKVQLLYQTNTEEELYVNLNAPLFEWVIENLCKNAIDAIQGEGRVKVQVTDNTQVVYIDVEDSGKGIHKSRYKTVFKPGFTTKDRGWGLGLSLSKRIVEEYHNGKIFVNYSELNRGTGIRIVLNK